MAKAPTSVTPQRESTKSAETPTPAKQPGHELKLSQPASRQHDRLALAFDAKRGRFRNEPQSEATPLAVDDSDEGEAAEGAAPAAAPTLADLIPTMGQLSRIAGAPANDQLDGVDVGDGTFLNSREFKYASFFNRVKRAVSGHWNPMNGHGALGERTWITVVNVTLDAAGNLSDIELARSSGSDTVDREAIAAFRSAGPFPNPPKGLIDPNGLMTFPFGFYIQPASQLGPRLRF